MRVRLHLLWLLASFASIALRTHDARACGGCFHPLPPPNEVESLVTEHRMAFAISTTQSVLWDQIRYSGDPKEFAWVLPVQPGTRVELSSDAWLAALDANTTTIIEPPPPPRCPPPFTEGIASDYGSSGAADDRSSASEGAQGNLGSTSGPPSGVCGCIFRSATGQGTFSDPSGSYVDGTSPGSSSGSTSGSSASLGELAGGASTPPPPPPVTVETQQTVGPYEVVLLHSSIGEALDAWLTANGFDIPANIQPILDTYVAQHMDFVAMKLRPGANVSAMRPVRVVEPGADPQLPLRMIAAGAGAHVGITLWVISEGRYEPRNFPNAKIDFTQLVYEVANGRSNYAALRASALAGGPAMDDDGGASTGSPAEAGLEAAAAAPPDAGSESAGDVGSESAGDAGSESAGDAGSESATDDAASDAAAEGAGASDEGAWQPGYWLTEFARPAVLTGLGAGMTPGLLDAYTQTCVVTLPVNPCDEGGPADGGGVDGSSDQGEAGDGPSTTVDGANEADAGGSNLHADATDDSGNDAAPEAGACTPAAPILCDDAQVALSGLHTGSIWITRLVADLPYGSLSRDLVLQPTADQAVVLNVHQASAWVDGDPCAAGLGSLSLRPHFERGPPIAAGRTDARGCALASRRRNDCIAACSLLSVALALLVRRKRRTG